MPIDLSDEAEWARIQTIIESNLSGFNAVRTNPELEDEIMLSPEELTVIQLDNEASMPDGRNIASVTVDFGKQGEAKINGISNNTNTPGLGTQLLANALAVIDDAQIETVRVLSDSGYAAGFWLKMGLTPEPGSESVGDFLEHTGAAIDGLDPNEATSPEQKELITKLQEKFAEARKTGEVDSDLIRQVANSGLADMETLFPEQLTLSIDLSDPKARAILDERINEKLSAAGLAAQGTTRPNESDVKTGTRKAELVASALHHTGRAFGFAGNMAIGVTGSAVATLAFTGDAQAAKEAGFEATPYGVSMAIQEGRNYEAGLRATEEFPGGILLTEVQRPWARLTGHDSVDPGIIENAVVAAASLLFPKQSEGRNQDRTPPAPESAMEAALEEGRTLVKSGKLQTTEAEEPKLASLPHNASVEHATRQQ